MDREDRAVMRKLADQLDAVEDLQQNLIAIIQLQQEIARREGHPLPTPPTQMSPQGPSMNLQALHNALKGHLDALNDESNVAPTDPPSDPLDPPEPPGPVEPPPPSIVAQNGTSRRREPVAP